MRAQQACDLATKAEKDIGEIMELITKAANQGLFKITITDGIDQIVMTPSKLYILQDLDYVVRQTIVNSTTQACCYTIEWSHYVLTHKTYN